MKNLVIVSLVAVLILGVTACQNEDSADSMGVDVQKYENLLAKDYANAQQNAYSAKIQNTTSENNKTTLTSSLLKNSLFHQHDSLFSKHFYDFAAEMMQHKGMINGVSGMMGTNGGMMGGFNMGSTEDMNQMIQYMDSLHNATKSMLLPNYSKHDSLMYIQMKNRHMMISPTLGIENTYIKMQQLRKSYHLNQ